MAAQVHGFQTEVSKLLRLLAKSLYSNSDVFLRELVSNASDAIDKLRFLSITKPELVKDDPVFSIRVRADREAGTLTITDNGIGMTEAEANEHLGTIAKSGTEAFLANLSGDEAKDSQLIGQFGVGFYSAFIVADRVTVISRSASAPENEAVRWESTGEGTYTSELTTRAARGTDVILHLKPEASKYLEDWELEEIIRTYSDHIATPVSLWKETVPAKTDEKDENVVEPAHCEWVQVNDAKALWTMNPREVKDEDYKAFYKHLTHEYADPLCWAHNRVEGEMEYTSLLYCPATAPWNLYDGREGHGLKLYVQRVFILDKAEAFLPHYLRFIRGLIDTNDLPLNVSRELLQESPVTRKLKKAVTKRALGMLEKLAAENDKYAAFWSEFGKCLKEGVVEDPANREAVMKLLRFASTKDAETEARSATVSLADYVARAPKEQTKIYYLVAGSYEAALSSPYLETFRKKGIEVLLLWERIDEWMMSGMPEFEGKAFVSVTASDLELGDLAKDDAEAQKKVEEAAGRPVPEEKFTLEINPSHPLIQKALAETDEARFADWADVIYEQAVLADQGTVKDPAGFVKRLNALLTN